MVVAGGRSENDPIPITLPREVETTVREAFAERGERWLAELPEVVAHRCREWELELVGPPFGGGTHSFVAPVRRGDGTGAVLKIPVVDEENAGEATGMHCYDGDGAVRLYDFDPDSGAMLLEWARPGTPLVVQPQIPLEGRPENEGRVQIACALYRRLRRPVGDSPAGYPSLPLVTDVVADWTRRLSDPASAAWLPPEVTAQARDWCSALAQPDGPPVIVNRDTHLGNIVAAEREPWLLIDPKAYLGEAAFDAGFLILKQVETHPDPARAGKQVAATAEGLEVDRERARGWAFMRALEETAWSFEDGRPEDVTRFLAVAMALA